MPSQITDFYKNQTVFITGGSGFIGKTVIEKLLRECHDLKKIYMLLRPKKNQTSQERFQELFNLPCFDILKGKNPESINKVELIQGDSQKLNLGMSDEDVKKIKKETTCVIHAAASVKFDQPLKEATLNIKSTKDLLDMATEMPNLKVIVYVSTAYSNCIHNVIKEEFYPTSIKPKVLYDIVENLDNKTLEKITPDLLGKWPNTYVFSKNLTENLMEQYSKKLPIMLIRPAVVISSYTEPIPGWIDNFYGIVGVTAGASLGVIRSLYCDPSLIAPIVPCDFVTNCLLAGAYERSKSNKTLIYNFVNHPEHYITWGEYMETVEPECRNCASEKVIWHFGFKLEKNKYKHYFWVYTMHVIVPYIIDAVLFLLAKPTIAVNAYRRLNTQLELMSYFSVHPWEFECDNVQKLWEKMSEEDKKVYHFDMKMLDWKYLAKVATTGGRKYLLKDTEDTFEKGRKKLQKLFFAYYISMGIFWFLMYKFVMYLLSLLF